MQTDTCAVSHSVANDSSSAGSALNTTNRAGFAGLEGVDAFANSQALEILRDLGHGPEFAALMRLAGIVEEQEAALKAAA